MADTETCVRERYVYFPGCRLLGAGQSPPEDSGIIINERVRGKEPPVFSWCCLVLAQGRLLGPPDQVPVVKDDRPKAFREKAKDDFTGWTVWASSIVASRWAAAHAAEFSGRDVLELGSGCGLAGAPTFLLTTATHSRAPAVLERAAAPPPRARRPPCGHRLPPRERPPLRLQRGDGVEPRRERRRQLHCRRRRRSRRSARRRRRRRVHVARRGGRPGASDGLG